MYDRATHRLLDAIAACTSVEEFVAGKSYSDYAGSYAFRLQIERLVQIIGEALMQARIVDPSISEQIDDIHQIVGMRNRLVHAYDSIDDELLWLTATSQVVVLRRQLELILAARES